MSEQAIKDYYEVCAERDRLKKKHAHGVEANHQAWNRIREQDMEIDRLKAELKSLERQRLANIDYAIAVTKDRDTWKTKAEKMMKALKRIMAVESPILTQSKMEDLWHYGSTSDAMKEVAKAALEEMGK